MKLVDMTEAYSVFATDGVRNPQVLVIKIADSAGKIIQEEKINSQRILDEQVARKINSILSDNVARTPIFGARSPLILDGRPVAAKTGTTSGFRDAWTVGYTPSIAVGVWAGNNDNHPMKEGADGVFVAAPIWHDYMTQILANQPVENFVAYDASSNQNNQNSSDMIAITTYYRKKSGKQISADQAAKTDPAKVEQRTQYVSATDPQAQGGAPVGSYSVALPSPTDPMFQRWTGQAQNTNN